MSVCGVFVVYRSHGDLLDVGSFDGVFCDFVRREARHSQEVGGGVLVAIVEVQRPAGKNEIVVLKEALAARDKQVRGGAKKCVYDTPLPGAYPDPLTPMVLTALYSGIR